MIDVHSHFLPPVYREALRTAGLATIDDWAIPDWDITSAMQAMDELGVQTQLVSLSAPGVTFVEGEQARALARAVNEFAAETIRDRAPRFGAFAVLPLPDVEGSLRELRYALDDLQLDGVGLLSNYDGLYLGQPEFDPIFAELDRRAAVVFIHPAKPPNFRPLSMGIPAPILEYPFDTTRMAVNLLRSGTIERHPNVKFILAHGGGTIPFLLPRLAFVLGPARTALLSRFFYDLTASTTPGQLAAISTLAPAGQLLMGFDFPFMSPAMNKPLLESYRQSKFDEADREAMQTGNALRLFPQVAKRLLIVA